MGKFIPVEPEKWAEMVKAQAEVARLKAECQARQAENSVLAVECDSLKAEVERLRFAEDLLKDENKHFREEEPLPDGWNSSVAKACDLIAEKDKEIARLKAEVERLTSDIQMEKENEDRLVREWQKANNEVYGLKTQVAALIDDQTRLKAEVERLTKQKAVYIDNERLLNEMERLKADVERLTKAGDEMAAVITQYRCSPWGQKVPTAFTVWDAWFAAKKGGQP